MIRPDLARLPEHARRLWVLNFDAEDELAHESAGGRTATASARARMETLAPHVASLVGSDAVVPSSVRKESTHSPARDALFGFAWCPTPSACRRLAQAGAIVLPPPSVDILRRANHRRFSAELGATLPGAGFFTEERSLRDRLDEHRAGTWVLKRPFAYAGRGRLLVRAGESEGAAATAWIRASMRHGGIDASPWVERLADHALHGFITTAGSFQLGAPTRQECGEDGRWRGSTRAHDLTQEEEGSLLAEAERTARALLEIGYFGPFGIDAFRYRSTSGTPAFCPRIEVNARYTMGWAQGFGTD